jgi:phosphohistidine phosphatase SixA
MSVRTRLVVMCCLVFAIVGLVTGVSRAQSRGSADLVAALQRGGYVLVMRHASSPREVPTADTANRDNVKRERQLDEAGRAGATAMGQALRRLKIPIDGVFTSPTYRARETVTYAQLASPVAVAELGDGGQSMQRVGEADAAWLRAKAAEAPARGNTIIVTHMPNVAQAFPSWGSLADGETVVARPDGKGGTTLIGRVKIEEWSKLR